MISLKIIFILIMYLKEKECMLQLILVKLFLLI